MKKIIIVLVCVFLIMGITMVGIKILNSKDADFPHFKQACLKYNGTAYGFAGKSFDLSFHFLDESELSEMTDESNILEMKIIDDKNNEKIVKINKMTSKTLNLSYTDDDYFLKNIYTSTVFEEEGKYTIKQVEVKYKDETVERFDIGNLNIIMENENNNKNFGGISYSSQFVGVSDIKDGVYCRISNIYMSIASYSDTPVVDAKIVDIDLGIDGMDVDYKNIEISDKPLDNELIDYYEKNKNSINFVDNLSNIEGQYDLSFSDKNVKTLIVPVTAEKFKKEPVIYIVTPKITYEIGNEQYTMHYRQNNFITPFVSLDEKKGGMNVVKYIEENGI